VSVPRAEAAEVRRLEARADVLRVLEVAVLAESTAWRRTFGEATNEVGN